MAEETPKMQTTTKTVKKYKELLPDAKPVEKTPTWKEALEGLLIGGSPLILEGLFGGGKYMGAAAAGGKEGLRGYSDVLRERRKAEEAADANRYANIVEEETVEPAGAGIQSARRFTKVPYEDASGVTRIGVMDRATGKIEMADSDPKAGFSTKYKTDPRTGEVIALSGAEAKQREFETSAPKTPLNVKEEKDVERAINKMRGTETYKLAEKRTRDAGTARDMISKGAIANEAVKTIIARMSGEVGAMSDRDIARFGGSKALTEQAKQFAKTVATGELSDENRMLLRQIIDIFEKRGREQMNSLIDSEVASLTARTGIDKAKAYAAFGPYRKVEKKISVKNKGVNNILKSLESIDDEDELDKLLEELGN